MGIIPDCIPSSIFAASRPSRNPIPRRVGTALDASDKVYLPMTRTVKAALVLLILSLCALGAIFSPKETIKEREPNTWLVPVNNVQPQRGVWLRV
jgi:hypothetical protein